MQLAQKRHLLGLAFNSRRERGARGLNDGIELTDERHVRRDLSGSAGRRGTNLASGHKGRILGHRCRRRYRRRTRRAIAR